MSHFIGKWKHERSENFEEVLVAAGVPWLARKMMKTTSPVTEINVAEDGAWTLKLIVAVKTKVTTFKIDQVYEDTVGMSGTVKKFIAKLEDGKLVIQFAENPEEGMITTREIVGDQLIMKLQFKDTVAHRYFRKVK
ncbi:sodium/calcium exchanger regulatory protein 1-like [Ptychodera flava]|uniref:sodium/calcium exchanger regulatory protein 1-like n=1 Tax=Ptychodera flava TaxID=63121 RepID=UPI00396A3B9C